MAAPVLQQEQQPASLEIHCTKCTRHPDDSASSMLPYEDHCQHKRRRDQSACEDIEEQPSAKRRKAASRNHPPEFWNALSKITLTRRALKEFDRRTAKEKTTPVVGAAKRSTRLLRSDTKRLLRFAKNGGPNLNHLRGYAELPRSAASMSKSSSRKGKRTRDSGLPSSNYTTGTSTTGPYDPQFEQMLIDKGIYPDGHRTTDAGRPPKPSNLDELRRVQFRTRPSLSPSAFSEGAFEEFQDMNRMAKSESKAMSSVIPIITGVQDRYYNTEENKQFNNLEKFAPRLRMPQPDKYYGARPTQIDLLVRRDLGKYIVPSTDATLPAAPNFFFEGKSAAGRPDVAQRQVMHDNAYGARAMFQLQNYGKETPEYDGNAYTIGSSYHPGTASLQLYATHPRQSANGGTEYHITKLDGFDMTGNIESFRRGAAAYRNSRDFTQQRRDRLITEANAIARSASTDVSSRTDGRTGTSFAMANTSFGSDTSTDELALHYDPASDESDAKARPRKRITQAASTGPRRRSSIHIPTPNVQASNTTIQGNRRQAHEDDTNGSNSSSDDEEYVTADGEQDEDEDNDVNEDGDEDEENVYTAMHGRSRPDEAALALQRSQSAQNVMARLLKQGYSQEIAFNNLVIAHQQSERVSRQVAIGEIRAMLASRV